MKNRKNPSRLLAALTVLPVAAVVLLAFAEPPLVRLTDTLNKKNPPLIFVDGVQISIEELNELDPDGFESISVIHDGETVRSFGENAPNGLIVIKSKSREIRPGVFEKVEHMPKFQGGDLLKFRNWVCSRVQYPDMAMSMNIQGTVKASFVVNADGSVGDIEILSDTDPLLNAEVVRIVKSSPKWEPGRQGVTPERVRFMIDVKFQM